MIEQLENDRVQELAESIVMSYLTEKGQRPESILCVDIEGLIQDQYGYQIIYENIAEEDASIVAFSANGVRPLQVRRNGRKEKVIFSNDCIVIDKYFLDPKRSIQKRFTLSHELGHKIYEKVSPAHGNGNYRTIFDATVDYSMESLRNQMNFCELEANKIGCALLMPHFLLVNTLKRVTNRSKFRIFGICQMLPEDSMKLQQMAHDLGVSTNMILIELKKQRLLEFGTVDKYLKLTGLKGGV